MIVKLRGRDLLACTTWFHQSQVYQPICTKLIYTELICTKPHLYHAPKSAVQVNRVGFLKVYRQALTHSHDFCLRQKSFGLFSIVPGPHGKFKVWYR